MRGNSDAGVMGVGPSRGTVGRSWAELTSCLNAASPTMSIDTSGTAAGSIESSAAGIEARAPRCRNAYAAATASPTAGSARTPLTISC